MSFVPFQDRGRRRTRRPPLDREQVVAAALALLDEVGLDELTMRRLAVRLGVKAASLYWHVRNKEELLALLADAISGEIPPVSRTGTWQSQATAMAQSYRRALGAHRDGARLLANTAPVGPRRLRHIETTLQILRSAGLSARDAARAAHHFNNFVTGFAADEARFAAAAAALDTSVDDLFAQARQQFGALPSREYPAIHELADHLAEHDPDALFQFGLDIWLRGIERLLVRGA